MCLLHGSEETPVLSALTSGESWPKGLLSLRWKHSFHLSSHVHLSGGEHQGVVASAAAVAATPTHPPHPSTPSLQTHE